MESSSPSRRPLGGSMRISAPAASASPSSRAQRIGDRTMGVVAREAASLLVSRGLHCLSMDRLRVDVTSRHPGCRSKKCGRVIALVAAAGLGLAGCSVGPDYERPQTETPAAWLSARQDLAAWPSTDWWRGFGSTQLDQFIAEAE